MCPTSHQNQTNTWSLVLRNAASATAMIHERTTAPTTLQVTPGKDQKRPHRSCAFHVRERNGPKQFKKSTLENQELPPPTRRPLWREPRDLFPTVVGTAGYREGGLGSVTTAVASGKERVQRGHPFRGTRGLRGGRRPSMLEERYSEHPR